MPYRNKLVETDRYTLMYELWAGEMYLHLHIHKWSHNVYKSMLYDLTFILRNLKNAGIDVVYTWTQENKVKLINMFGFTEFHRNNGKVFMARVTT